MTLTQDTLEQYFEKSERMNLLQNRIKSFASILQRRLSDTSSEFVYSLSWKEKQEERGGLVLRSTEKGAITLRYYMNHRLTELRFDLHVITGGQSYLLSEANLPADIVEDVYSNLAYLTKLIVQLDVPFAYRTAKELEGEILTYLNKK